MKCFFVFIEFRILTLKSRWFSMKSQPRMKAHISFYFFLIVVKKGGIVMVSLGDFCEPHWFGSTECCKRQRDWLSSMLCYPRIDDKISPSWQCDQWSSFTICAHICCRVKDGNFKKKSERCFQLRKIKPTANLVALHAAQRTGRKQTGWHCYSVSPVWNSFLIVESSVFWDEDGKMLHEPTGNRWGLSSHVRYENEEEERRKLTLIKFHGFQLFLTNWLHYACITLQVREQVKRRPGTVLFIN